MDTTLEMNGLSSAEVASRRAKFGENRMSEERHGALAKMLRLALSPISLMLAAAAALSAFIGHTGDAWFILVLLGLNVGVSVWHESKADHALEALRKRLTVEARVLRDGAWQSIPSEALVPGDYIEVGVGDLVPADATIREAENVSLNESVVTGESLPKEKQAGENLYAGGIVATGILRAEITKIGNATYFGSLVKRAKPAARRSSLEREVLAISRYLMYISGASIAILSAVLYLTHKPLADILLLDVSLLIAGLPVSLPTVMTLIINAGAAGLVKKDVLTRRLASLEDLANVTLLLTDKTGTLTESTITVERVVAYAPWTEEEVLALAAGGASKNPKSLIDGAILAGAKARGAALAPVRSFIPADSNRKRSTTLLNDTESAILVSAGTPPVIEKLSTLSEGALATFHNDVAAAAADGSRVIAVSAKKGARDEKDESDMSLVGIIVLSDPLRAEAPEVINFLEHEGVRVQMVTGDTSETAERIRAQLGLPGETVSCREGEGAKGIGAETLAHAGAFAEVLPDDKLVLVRAAQGAHETVAVTGDGVNDLPAMRAASVGIAVANAVEALKGAADIVLLSHGIGVIRDALIEARSIFMRLASYATYRISESFRLVLTVLVLGLIYADFPLSPVELLLIALLNDIPIITLAFDRVKRGTRPANLVSRERLELGSFFGLVGVANSLLMFFFLTVIIHAPWDMVQAAFFLKLTVSGHMLIYVAHTKERWWKFLPAKSIIIATTLTQILATGLVLFGFIVPALPFPFIILVWVWSFVWMQVAELMKALEERLHPVRQ